MARSHNQKIKILLLEKMLRNTDENHVVTMQEILDSLAEYEIPAERKSIYDDMEVLRSFGMNIQFERGKATGSSANLSFLHDGVIYITGSGTCFGRLTKESFSKVSWDGEVLNGVKPSKELPLHKMYYEKSDSIQAVVHVHSFYATMYSFFKQDDVTDIVPEYTPYLKMKVGKVGLVPYEKPGSKELFECFEKAALHSDAFILAQHGPVVGGKTMMDAFYGLEELEESCKIAWTLDQGRKEIIPL